jgi:hypothetical protein
MPRSIDPWKITALQCSVVKTNGLLEHKCSHVSSKLDLYHNGFFSLSGTSDLRVHITGILYDCIAAYVGADSSIGGCVAATTTATTSPTTTTTKTAPTTSATK